jgi:hypothetical protein
MVSINDDDRFGDDAMGRAIKADFYEKEAKGRAARVRVMAQDMLAARFGGYKESGSLTPRMVDEAMETAIRIAARIYDASMKAEVRDV